MTKQIDLKINGNDIVAYMNEIILFKVNNENKTIDIDSLYKSLNVQKEDSIINIIKEIESNDKTSLEILYENTKMFLDELLKRINDVLVTFDFKNEEKLLINQ